MLAYARSPKKYRLSDEFVLAENYKSFAMDKTKDAQEIIESEIFGERNFSSTLVLSSSTGGVYFDYHFYKVGEDNICLGIEAYNVLQDDAVVYVNTAKDCGSKCKVYLNEPEEKQVFYVWEPKKEIITDETKEKITIKTDKGTYTFFARTGITELEVNCEGLPKIKSVKGLEKFPNLINLAFTGIDG